MAPRAVKAAFGCGLTRRTVLQGIAGLRRPGNVAGVAGNGKGGGMGDPGAETASSTAWFDTFPFREIGSQL